MDDTCHSAHCSISFPKLSRKLKYTWLWCTALQAVVLYTVYHKWKKLCALQRVGWQCTTLYTLLSDVYHTVLGSVPQTVCGVMCITHYGVVCTTLWSGMHHTVGWYAPQCAPHCTGASLQPHGAVLDHLQWSGQGTCSQHCSSCQLTEWGKVSTIGFLFSLIRHILQHFFGVKQNIFMPSATEFLFCCWFVFFFVKTIYIPYYTKVMFFDDFNFFILQIII